MVMDDLTQRLAADLDGTYESVVRGHQDRLYGIALRMLGDPRDAEEAAQDAFVRAYRALAGYDADRIRELSLRGWLVTIVLNVCRNRARRRRPGAISLDGEPARVPAILDPAPTPPERAERREGAAYWMGLLAALPPRYREVVVLRYVEGLGYGELTAVLGRPEGTLKAQAHRGLALLRAAHDAALRTDRSGDSQEAPR